MTERTNDPGEQPGNDTQAQASEQQQQPAPTALWDLSADELLEIASGEAEAPAQPTQAESEPAPQPETPPSAQPAGEPEGSDAPAKPPGRLSVRSLPAEQQLETAQALEMVRKGEAADLLDALSQIRGVTQAPQGEGSQPEKANEQAPSTPAKAPAVAQIEERIATLREERKVAKTVDYDTDKEEALTNQIEDALMELQEAKLLAQQQAQAAQADAKAASAWEAEYQKANDELERDYPAALDDDSEFSDLLASFMAKAKEDQNPKLNDPRYILELAAKADRLTTKTPGKRPSDPPPAPKPTGKALAPAHSAINRPTVDQVQQTIAEAEPEELLEYLANS